MSTKGEKQGFSGGIEHWMVCKVLKRKDYYLSSYPWLAAFSLSLDLVVVFRIEVQSTEQVEDAKLLAPFHVLSQGCRHRFLLGLVTTKAARFLD
jgi:hypothetical protein